MAGKADGSLTNLTLRQHAQRTRWLAAPSAYVSVRRVVGHFEQVIIIGKSRHNLTHDGIGYPLTNWKPRPPALAIAKLPVGKFSKVYRRPLRTALKNCATGVEIGSISELPSSLE